MRSNFGNDVANLPPFSSNCLATCRYKANVGFSDGSFTALARYEVNYAHTYLTPYEKP